MGTEDLGEGLVGVDERTMRRPHERRVASLDCADEDLRPGSEVEIDGLREIRSRARVHERAECGEDDGHADGERDRHTDAERQLHEDAPSDERNRYPTPRTVSIESRPNGRSTFSRRYRT